MSELRVEFALVLLVLGLTPVLASMAGLNAAVNPTELVPTVWEVERVTPVV